MDTKVREMAGIVAGQRGYVEARQDKDVVLVNARGAVTSLTSQEARRFARMLLQLARRVDAADPAPTASDMIARIQALEVPDPPDSVDRFTEAFAFGLGYRAAIADVLKILEGRDGID